MRDIMLSEWPVQNSYAAESQDLQPANTADLSKSGTGASSIKDHARGLINTHT